MTRDYTQDEDVNFWRRVVGVIDLDPKLRLKSWEKAFIYGLIIDPEALTHLSYKQKERLLTLLDKVEK